MHSYATIGHGIEKSGIQSAISGRLVPTVLFRNDHNPNPYGLTSVASAQPRKSPARVTALDQLASAHQIPRDAEPGDPPAVKIRPQCENQRKPADRTGAAPIGGSQGDDEHGEQQDREQLRPHGTCSRERQQNDETDEEVTDERRGNVLSQAPGSQRHHAGEDRELDADQAHDARPLVTEREQDLGEPFVIHPHDVGREGIGVHRWKVPGTQDVQAEADVAPQIGVGVGRAGQDAKRDEGEQPQ